jgi:phosphoserine phosphatase RsbU/P
MKVLIAEDDQVALRVLRMTLEKFGHQVVSTSNGGEAWSAFDSQPTRIVVSDWMMPELDGLALCQKIRSRKNTEYTYFIMVTARVSTENYHEAMASGVDDFLTKPLDRDELFMRLRVAERILGFTTRIEQLEKILPICSYCKKIRDEDNSWHPVEKFLAQQTRSGISHGVCPQCYEDQVKPMMSNWKNRAKEKS